MRYNCTDNIMESYEMVFVVLQITICGIAFCLHILGFLAIYFYHKRTNQNVILFFLSFVEIIISITGPMFRINNHILKDFLGKIGDKTVFWIENIVIYQLVFIMYTLTIDRLVCIINPLRYKARMTRKIVLALIFVSWAISISA